MAGETIITLVGNLTADPELRFTSGGAAVANFTIASTPRAYDKDSGQWKDGDALFMRCSLWRQYAENVAESLTKGMRVIAIGTLKQRSYEAQGGEKRTVVELDVTDIGPALQFATAKVTKAGRSSSDSNGWANANQGGAQRSSHAAGNDPWSADSNPGGGWGNQSDEPPY